MTDASWGVVETRRPCRACGDPTFVINGERAHGGEAGWRYCCKGKERNTVAR